MGELEVLFDKQSPQDACEDIKIHVSSDRKLFYKFILGNEGIWTTLQDFSEKDICRWVPKEEGKYIIMIQGKEEGSKKPFDIMTKEEFIIGDGEKVKLIKDVKIDNVNLILGEKINIEVVSSETPILYRFWLKGDLGWEPIRDYTTSNKLSYTTIKEGRNEILIECKRLDSSENFDEFTTIRFEVAPIQKIEIVDFKCLTEQLLINEELVFKVEATYGDNRSLLYKFIKINKEGKATCIQDYSSRRMVSYQEKEAGEYKLLCLVRDILSNKDYDDRAIMLYNVKPYNDVKIKSFESDIKSPQINGSNINLIAKVHGGRELVYRYIIEGPIAEDSGYIRSNEFNWETKEPGEYNITLYVKDISFEGEYEAKKKLLYSIDKKSDKPVRIKDVIVSNSKNAIIGQPVNIKVIGEGGVSLKYSFLVYKNNKETERIDFGSANWVNFTPEEKGEYEVEIRVKDKYSIKEYDAHTFVYLKVREYVPGEIDYILINNKDQYLVGDNIELEVITQNTKSVLMKYVTKINGHVVEETDFIKNKKLKVKPKCSGKYTFEVYAKNVKCEEEYDNKKDISLYVAESTPVISTKILSDNREFKVNKEATFRVESTGGKDVCYEFYIMERGNWVKAQSFSRKNYYTFIPFIGGEYRIMVLAKSYYKKVNYEDYDELTFNVSL